MRTITAKRWVTILSIAVVVAVGGCKGSPTPAPTPIATALPTPTGPRFGGAGVVASGEIVPAREADVSFTISGRVGTVTVARGDEVQPDEVLVTLESDLLEADVRQAEAALAAAEAELARVAAGHRPEEVAVAEARMAAAEGTLAQAAAQRDQPDLGATEPEVAEAQAQVAGAMADRLLAEEVHDQTMKCVNVNRPGGEKKTLCPLLGPTEEKARYRWHAAGEALDAAQAQLNALLAGGDAEVRAAQACVLTAAARRDAAQAELEAVQAGPGAEEIAAAEAAVTQARAELETARAALDRATLRAPFAGTVAAVDVSPGEAVTPGQVVLTLADMQQAQARTTDLSERNVDQVSVGQPARVYVEALNKEIEGRVVEIASQANTVGGDVVYAVTIALDDGSPRLRWGMSVEVEIAAE
jgi:HlyD family secretion protein